MDDIFLNGVIYDSDGGIDWNANGWPVPNPGRDAHYEGYSLDNMPASIFDIWEELCDVMDIDWSSDW